MQGSGSLSAFFGCFPWLSGAKTQKHRSKLGEHHAQRGDEGDDQYASRNGAAAVYQGMLTHAIYSVGGDAQAGSVHSSVPGDGVSVRKGCSGDDLSACTGDLSSALTASTASGVSSSLTSTHLTTTTSSLWLIPKAAPSNSSSSRLVVQPFAQPHAGDAGEDANSSSGTRTAQNERETSLQLPIHSSVPLSRLRQVSAGRVRTSVDMQLTSTGHSTEQGGGSSFRTPMDLSGSRQLMYALMGKGGMNNDLVQLSPVSQGTINSGNLTLNRVGSAEAQLSGTLAWQTTSLAPVLTRQMSPCGARIKLPADNTGSNGGSESSTTLYMSRPQNGPCLAQLMPGSSSKPGTPSTQDPSTGPDMLILASSKDFAALTLPQPELVCTATVPSPFPLSSEGSARPNTATASLGLQQLSGSTLIEQLSHSLAELVLQASLLPAVCEGNEYSDNSDSGTDEKDEEQTSSSMNSAALRRSHSAEPVLMTRLIPTGTAMAAAGDHPEPTMGLRRRGLMFKSALRRCSSDGELMGAADCASALTHALTSVRRLRTSKQQTAVMAPQPFTIKHQRSPSNPEDEDLLDALMDAHPAPTSGKSSSGSAPISGLLGTGSGNHGGGTSNSSNSSSSSRAPRVYNSADKGRVIYMGPLRKPGGLTRHNSMRGDSNTGMHELGMEERSSAAARATAEALTRTPTALVIAEVETADPGQDAALMRLLDCSAIIASAADSDDEQTLGTSTVNGLESLMDWAATSIASSSDMSNAPPRVSRLGGGMVGMRRRRRHGMGLAAVHLGMAMQMGTSLDSGTGLQSIPEVSEELSGAVARLSDALARLAAASASGATLSHLQGSHSPTDHTPSHDSTGLLLSGRLAGAEGLVFSTDAEPNEV